MHIQVPENGHLNENTGLKHKTNDSMGMGQKWWLNQQMQQI